MTWPRWKSAELEVAKFFKGRRRVRVDYSERIGDIIHEVFSIEVKYGNQVPKLLRAVVPTILKMGKKRYWVCPSRWLKCDGKSMIVDSIAYLTLDKKKNKFLEEAMSQAKRYNPDLIPVVCVKSQRMKGFVAIWEERRKIEAIGYVS